ncbi:Snake venom 5'-nucleotidase, variant 2 [Balamuthia mandrillaris]
MAEAEAAVPKADLVLLHFNDVYDVEPAAKEPVGGATRFATALKTLRQQASSPPLVLFSGDVFNPSLLSAITKGKHMVNVMNELHIQASVYGNHEFDFGVEQLRKNVSQCNFPWLMSNLIDTATGLPFAGGHRHLVLPWNGLKVGLIGLVEQEWLVTLAYLPESVEYRDFVTEGQALVEELKDKEGCDLVIALTHMRAPNDNRLAKGVPRLDLILSGHDHFYEVWQEPTHNTTIVKSGTEFRYISQVELFLDSNSPNHKPRVITKKIEVTKEFEEDENMKQILSCFQEMMNTKLNKVIGRTSVMLDARNAFVRTGETNLGSMICDIMRTTMGADVALLNSGTIRSDSSYGPGDIKLKDLMTILPFADTIVIIEVTGQQLWDAFENGVSKWPLQEGEAPFHEVKSIIILQECSSESTGKRVVRSRREEEKEESIAFIMSLRPTTRYQTLEDASSGYREQDRLTQEQQQRSLESGHLQHNDDETEIIGLVGERDGFWHSLPCCPQKRPSKRATVAVIGFIALVLIVAGIAISVSLSVKDDTDSSNNKPTYSFDDIFSLNPKSFTFQWFSINSTTAGLIYSDKERNIFLQKVYVDSNENQNNSHTTVFPDVNERVTLFNVSLNNNSLLVPSLGSQYSLSYDASYLLLPVHQSKIWRHSFEAKFVLFSVANQDVHDNLNEDAKQTNAIWSPTSLSVAFVQDDDIYLRKDVSSTEQSPIRITTDGSLPGITNGVQVWVYEEEIFADYSAMWWAPDGSQLAFLRFNQSAVPQVTMPMYEGNPYPTLRTFHYPKPGYPNPDVSVGVFNVTAGSTVFLNIGNSTDMYVTAVEWVDSITISVTTSNRLQNKQTVLLVNTLTNASRILEVTVSKNGWLEPDSNLKFISINNTVQYFVDTVPDDNGFMQIALYNYSSAELIQTFSAGKKRDVTQILGWYSPTDSLLFVSTASASSAKQDEESFTSLEERAIFSIDDFTKQTGGGKKKREIQDENNWRLLSKVNASSDHPAETEGWWGCSFHEKSGFYVLAFGGNGDVRHVPFTTLHHLHVQDMMVTLESNNDFKANISKLALPTYKFLSIPLQLGENQTTMNAWQLLPPNFQSDKAYPMLLKVYGGPGSQGVTKQYALGFDAYLASQGYVIAAVDGRGTAFRGNDWKFSVYENLGQVESEDQIAAVKFMSKSRYIDSSRLGVWGWSYGGYMTSKILQSSMSSFCFVLYYYYFLRF